MRQYLHTQKPYFIESHKQHLHNVAVYTAGCKHSRWQRGVRPGEGQNTVERVGPAKLRGCGKTPCSIQRHTGQKERTEIHQQQPKASSPKAWIFIFIPSHSGCPGSMQACEQWLLRLSPSHGPLQSSTRVQCAARDNVKNERKKAENKITAQPKRNWWSLLTTVSNTTIYLENILQAIWGRILGKHTFQKFLQCSKSVFVQFLCEFNRTCYFDSSSIGINRCFAFINHPSLLWVQYFILFIFFWCVHLRWQGNHTVHTHF